jgi:hypothetical protein
MLQVKKICRERLKTLEGSLYHVGSQIFSYLHGVLVAMEIALSKRNVVELSKSPLVAFISNFSRIRGDNLQTRREVWYDNIL